MLTRNSGAARMAKPKPKVAWTSAPAKAAAARMARVVRSRFHR
jgi:hypothetical protein